MKTLAAIFTLIAMLAAVPAAGALNGHQLDDVSAEPGPGAAFPPNLAFTDEGGHPQTFKAALHDRPSVVIFADYTCHTLCGPILDFAAHGLATSGLKAGQDYRVVIIGLDPKDALEAAQTMRERHFGSSNPVANATEFLTGTAAAIADATAAVGYHYRYDSEHDQFAHPAAVYVTDREGRVRRVLSGLGLDGADLRLALVAAGGGVIGTLGDRIRLLCYGYDPARGVYTERITAALEIAAVLTLLVLAAGIVLMRVMTRRRAAS